MFTGLVEEMGIVLRNQVRSGRRELAIGCTAVLEGTRVGDSIAVDGACLTVVSLTASSFTAEVMPATLAVTTLGALRPGTRVNLERSLRLGDRLGGHLVTGHIDGTGRILDRRTEGDALLLDITAPPDLMPYVIARGSVAVNGVSLTVVSRQDDRFTISIIPHTTAVTTLGQKAKGDPVNLETDLIGKYVYQMLRPNVMKGSGPTAGSGFTVESLAQLGY